MDGRSGWEGARLILASDKSDWRWRPVLKDGVRCETLQRFRFDFVATEPTKLDPKLVAAIVSARGVTST